MAYRPMDDDKVRAFLTRLPARPAILATTRADGRPHVAPVWYTVDDDGTLLFNTGETTVKGRNLRRTGWAAMSVDDDAAPFSFVTLEGPVTIELGSESLEAKHRVVRPGRDEDWAELYGVWREYWPAAADYETKTDRKFPVAVITPEVLA